MALTLSGNSVGYRPGAPCFIVASDRYDYFRLGLPDGEDYFLEGRIAPGPEFVFNGRLFIPGIADPGVIIDSFPKGPVPSGWVKRPRMDDAGYELASRDTGKVLFGFRVVRG